MKLVHARWNQLRIASACLALPLLGACFGPSDDNAASTASDALNVGCGGDGGTSAAANLLKNGSFEAGLDPWIFSAHGGAAGTQAQDSSTFADGAHSERVDVTTATPSSPWNAQLQQAGVSLVSGQAVTVTVWAKAASSATILCSIQQNASPWTEYASHTIALTTAWAKYEFTFTPTATDPNALFGLNFAGSTGTFWVDSVSVAPSGAASPPPAPDAGGGGTGGSAPPQAAGYKLAFSDDFTSIDLSPNGTGNHTWYNGYWWEKPAPASDINVSNSILTLSWPRGQSPADTSITTSARDGSSVKAWRYGYFEARMRWDAVVGHWPAFWLLPMQDLAGTAVYNGVKETGEIDVFEGMGDTPHSYYGTVHDWKNSNQDVYNNNGKNEYVLPSSVDFSQFHSYGVLWTPGKLVWYFDNQPIIEAATSAVFDKQDYYLILSSQEGVDWHAGDLTGVAGNTINLDVDWVHVWQK